MRTNAATSIAPRLLFKKMTQRSKTPLHRSSYLLTILGRTSTSILLPPSPQPSFHVTCAHESRFYMLAVTWLGKQWKLKECQRHSLGLHALSPLLDLIRVCNPPSNQLSIRRACEDCSSHPHRPSRTPEYDPLYTLSSAKSMTSQSSSKNSPS